MELRATTDWHRLEEAVNAIAGKASVGVSVQAHADSLWVRLGTRQLTPLALYEDGQWVGALFYSVDALGEGKNLFHVAGCYMNGTAKPNWLSRLSQAVLPLARSLGCDARLYFSSPRKGWGRMALAAGYDRVSQGYLYAGGRHG